VITEKRLAISHLSFWERTIPMGTVYVRRVNLSPERYVQPLLSDLVQERGVINEAAFRLLCAAARAGGGISALTESDTQRSVAEAVAFIRRFRQFSREPVADPDRASVLEAITLGQRLERFVGLDKAPVVFAPRFPGCGCVDECNGDLLQGDCLCAIKAGDSGFRTQDLRQVLVYCALNFASRTYPINAVCLVNPRRGVYWTEKVDALCLAIAGTSPADVYGEIIDYISEPHWRDEAV
jgi:hypothetical protein